MLEVVVSNTLTFEYSVLGGDRTDDLNYTDENALTLNGGSILESTNNNPAILVLPIGDNSLSGVKDISVIGVPVFTSFWDTSAISTNSSNLTTIKLPLQENGEYDFRVDWGDGNVSLVSRWDSVNSTHNYASSGIKEIDIIGELKGFGFNNLGDRNKLINITKWGPLNLGNNGGYFYGASNLENISGKVNLSGTTNFENVFRDVPKFNGDISGWNVSQVIDMSGMFSDAASFNGDISSWDVSNVTDMSGMFSDAASFNGDISSWDVSNVRDMSDMFSDATSFDGDISSWNVSRVTDMTEMFKGAAVFNQPLNNWDVSGVTDMLGMFSGAAVFNQDIGDWDVSGCTDMCQ